ncbi:DUF6515 family protein [Caldimonas manganoxidans]|uniref:DUF6515 family protein n=1 Tax=Caldimonas manganoxidans TaxID=196015 RepID=UPI00037EB545|nr:DUF6515 family protein [Caldimonas manganoxidans]
MLKLPTPLRRPWPWLLAALWTASGAWAQEGWRPKDGRDADRERPHPLSRVVEQHRGWQDGPRVGERFGQGQRPPRVGESRLSGDGPAPERPARLRDGPPERDGSARPGRPRDEDRSWDDGRRWQGQPPPASSGGSWQPVPPPRPPRPGHVVYQLPPTTYSTVYLGAPYWFYQGVWYSRRGSAYVVVRPPVGLYVSTLPYYHRVVYWGPSVYYVLDDVYYAPLSTGGYQVVEPPSQAASASFDYPIAYPARQQSAQQQADDQFQCHEWAVSVSRFDPSWLGSGQPMEDSPTLRDNYRRAWSACMEGRGYSVR